MIAFAELDQAGHDSPGEKQCVRATKSHGRIERNEESRNFRLLTEKKSDEMGGV